MGWGVCLFVFYLFLWVSVVSYGSHVPAFEGSQSDFARSSSIYCQAFLMGSCISGAVRRTYYMGFFSCEVSPMEKPGGNGPTGSFLHSGLCNLDRCRVLHLSLILTQCETAALASRPNNHDLDTKLSTSKQILLISENLICI